MEKTPANSGAENEGGSITSRALANIKRGTVMEFAGLKLEAVAQITRTVLVQADDTPIAVMFEGPILKGTSVETGKKAESREPPHIAHVLNIATGERQVLICNVVLRRELEQAFPNADYIGRTFAVRSVKGQTKGGNSIRLYDIVEVKAPGEYSEIVREVDAAKAGLIANWRADQKAATAAATSEAA